MQSFEQKITFGVATLGLKEIVCLCNIYALPPIASGVKGTKLTFFTFPLHFYISLAKEQQKGSLDTKKIALKFKCNFSNEVLRKQMLACKIC